MTKQTAKLGTKKAADKENIESVLSIMANEIAAATQFDATQRVFNPIETPNESSKPTNIQLPTSTTAIDKKKN